MGSGRIKQGSEVLGETCVVVGLAVRRSQKTDRRARGLGHPSTVAAAGGRLGRVARDWNTQRVPGATSTKPDESGCRSPSSVGFNRLRGRSAGIGFPRGAAERVDY